MTKILLYYLSIEEKLRSQGPTLIGAKEQELEKKYYCRALVIGRYYDADKEEPPTESAEVLDMSPPSQVSYGALGYPITSTFPTTMIGTSTVGGDTGFATTSGGQADYTSNIKW